MPVTQQNYLKVAGYVDEPDPESEAMLPAELQLKARRSKNKTLQSRWRSRNP
jgi:hypothetical protein